LKLSFKKKGTRTQETVRAGQGELDRMKKKGWRGLNAIWESKKVVSNHRWIGEHWFQTGDGGVRNGWFDRKGGSTNGALGETNWGVGRFTAHQNAP